ncbi:MAG: acyltransferase [Chitinophagaceae bacterium]|nr:MAG: acyltransferase [Chitinophagaceae bacterium]
MIAWGAIISDTWLNPSTYPLEIRREIMIRTASDPLRPYPFSGESKPVILEGNCWVGFDAVILPGVRLGRGCVVGCKTVISKDVPPYAVMAGNPAKIIKFLTADDSPEFRKLMMKKIVG